MKCFFTGKSIASFVDEDIPLVAAASDKQRSRIQIKKGPNGQEYEYEYVYYYYDDDEDPKDKVKLNYMNDGDVEITYFKFHERIIFIFLKNTTYQLQTR